MKLSEQNRMQREDDVITPLYLNMANSFLWQYNCWTYCIFNHISQYISYILI